MELKYIIFFFLLQLNVPLLPTTTRRMETSPKSSPKPDLKNVRISFYTDFLTMKFEILYFYFIFNKFPFKPKWWGIR